MPVKIKNIHNGKVELIDIRESKTQVKYQHNIWTVVAGKDIVQITEPFDHRSIIDRGKHEKKDLEEILTGHPEYIVKDVPDWGNWDEFIVTEDQIQDSNINLSYLDDLVNIDKQKSTSPINKNTIAISKSIWTLQNWTAIFTIIGAIIALVTFIIIYIVPLIPH